MQVHEFNCKLARKLYRKFFMGVKQALWQAHDKVCRPDLKTTHLPRATKQEYPCRILQITFYVVTIL